MTDIQKLKKEHPEKFDFADIPADLNVDPAYQAAMDARMPQWLKDMPTEGKRKSGG